MPSNNIPLKLNTLTPSELFSLAVSPLRSQVAEKELEYVEDIQVPDGSIEVDKLKLTWVLNAMLVNAIRYTPRWGRITVSARKDGHNVRISVTDTGQGIRFDRIELVFEAMTQLFTEDQARTGGMGLSLPLAREIIEAHGGSVSVDSKAGQGTTFNIFLPLK